MLLVLPLQASGPVTAPSGARMAPGILRDPTHPDRLRLMPALAPGAPGSAPRVLPRALPPGGPLVAEPHWDSTAIYGPTCGTWFGAGRLWARGEYLLWWTRGTDLPALVEGGQTATDIGVLYGDETRLDQLRAGGRFRLGWWFDPCHTRGVEFTYLGLIGSSDRFFANDATLPFLRRPFFLPGNIRDNLEIANPAFLTGGIEIDLDTRFHALDVAYRRALFHQGPRRLDLLLGYRYAGLQEDLRIDQNSVWIGPAPGVRGTTIQYLDDFQANNTFNGGQLGLVYQTDRYGWQWDVAARVALGSTAARVDVAGLKTVVVPGAPGDGTAVTPGGLLAQPTNIDRFERNYFSVIPEIGVNASYDLTCRLRASIGYSFLAWTQVMRPADQIDTTVDLTATTGNPEFPDQTTTFWAQGAQVGLEYRW